MIALDSSVVIASFGAWHEHHTAARQILGGGPRLPVHASVEAYSVLTRLPEPFRPEPHLVAEFLRRTFTTEHLALDVDESALRRPLGSRAVQRAQLQHLIEMAQRPNITLQVVPFHVGGPAAVGGPFTILRFSEPGLPDVVYLEQLASALYLDKERDTVGYLEIMDSLCIEAESPEESIDFLRRIIEDLPHNP